MAERVGVIAAKIRITNRRLRPTTLMLKKMAAIKVAVARGPASHPGEHREYIHIDRVRVF